MIPAGSDPLLLPPTEGIVWGHALTSSSLWGYFPKFPPRREDHGVGTAGSPAPELAGKRVCSACHVVALPRPMSLPTFLHRKGD